MPENGSLQNICSVSAFYFRDWQMENDSLSFHELEQASNKRAKDMAAYTAVWSTEGCKVSKDGQRHYLRLHFQVRLS